MELNYSNIIIFIIAISSIIAGYYHFILTIDEGEDKRIKMVKRVLVLLVLTGVIHIYSITEDVQLKQFFIIILALIINVYSVFHSTKKCNFPRLYLIKLSLYSALVTFIIAGIIWYTSNNTLFGFMFSEEQSEVINKATSVFTSKLIESDINFDGEVDCPDPKDEDNYTIEMDNLNNGSDADKLKYRACLEQEIRSDLKKGI
uniref:Uncharacterized protein n=1 Tax=viral metagenome TaxID=1070528 RepID=A0A6C0CEL7_9ZZZZ